MRFEISLHFHPEVPVEAEGAFAGAGACRAVVSSCSPAHTSHVFNLSSNLKHSMQHSKLSRKECSVCHVGAEKAPSWSPCSTSYHTAKDHSKSHQYAMASFNLCLALPMWGRADERDPTCVGDSGEGRVLHGSVDQGVAGRVGHLVE